MHALKPLPSFNLALNKPAQQSSLSYYSKPEDAQGAVNGIKTGSFGFHTNKEINPWWQVDLEDIYNLSEIRIYNRLDTALDRISTLEVLVSPDDHNWQTIYVNKQNKVFGGIDGQPLIISIPSIVARFVRLQLKENNYLHVDEVEVFGNFCLQSGFGKNLEMSLPRLTTDKETKARFIIYQSHKGGLCNRLMTLSHCLSLGYFWNIPVMVCWQPKKSCSCYLEEILEPNFSSVSHDEVKKLLKDVGSETLYINQDLLGFNFAYNRYFHKSKNISYEDYRDKYLEFVSSLQIESKIKLLLDRFIADHWTENIVGIHIRRTDHVTHFASKPDVAKNLSTDEKFFQKIEREISQGVSRFFLATDDLETKVMFENKYPGMFISYCQEFNDSQFRQTSLQDALADLYLLSKTRKLIGSSHSTFSVYASELGGIPLEFA
jgi:hypothetical protein